LAWLANRLAKLTSASAGLPRRRQFQVTARNAPNDAATLARLAKELAEEVERIHDLRRGRTTSKPWQEELASQMPADIVTLRKALDEARDAISDLGAERHSLKNGQLSTAFLARFAGDTAAAIAVLPNLIEEAHARHKATAAALDAKALDQARAENALIEGWLGIHREHLRAMRSEFAAAYDRQQVQLARLHTSIVAIDPWKETSYCGVLLKIVDATLLLLDSERSMDNYMESNRLSRSFAHLTGAEWEDLEMNIRRETGKLGGAPSVTAAPPVDDPRVAWHQSIMHVLDDLDLLVRSLRNAPNMKLGLQEYDEVHRTGIDFDDHGAPWLEPIKTATSRLQSSLEVSNRIARGHPGIRRTFRQAQTSHWGGMSAQSHHETAYAAAAVVQSAAKLSGREQEADKIMREQVLRTANDEDSVKRLRLNLDRELELALLSPWEQQSERHMNVDVPAGACIEDVPVSHSALMNGKTSSEMIGITESTLSRWRSTTPAWADGNPKLFAHLMERDQNRLYKRDRVTKLGAWWNKAMQEGATRPVDCP
jgi:hypothetical protein